METKFIGIGDLDNDIRGLSMDEDLSVFEGNIHDGRNGIIGNSQSFYFNAYTYLIVRHGKATVRIDQRTYIATRGTLITASPLHLVTYVEVSDDFEFAVLAVTHEMIDKLRTIDIAPRIEEGIRKHLHPVEILTGAEAECINKCFEDLGIQMRRVHHSRHKELVGNSLSRFFLEYDNMLQDRKGLTGVDNDISGRQQQILDKFMILVKEHCRERHEVKYYSKSLGITPQYLNKIIKKLTGIVASEFISEILYAQARNMLASKRYTIQEISSILGFADQSTFGKFFKRHFGASPSKLVRTEGQDHREQEYQTPYHCQKS